MEWHFLEIAGFKIPGTMSHLPYPAGRKIGLLHVHTEKMLKPHLSASAAGEKKATALDVSDITVVARPRAVSRMSD
jgi:hypothetical protein